MPHHALIAIAGGLLSAFLPLAFVGGSFVGLMSAFFAPLPLFLVGLGLGLKALFQAASTGLVALGFLGGWLTSSEVNIQPNWLSMTVYCLFYFLPAFLICRARSPNTGRSILKPPSDADSQLGWILISLAISSAMIFAFSVFAEETKGFTKVILNEAISETINKSLPNLDTVHRSNFIKGLFIIMTNPVFPGWCSSSWIILIIINAVIAQGLLVQFKKNVHPNPVYRNCKLPAWWSWPLILAASIALFGTVANLNVVEFLGRNLAMIFSIPYFFVGLAVVHQLASQTSFKWFYLTLMYLALIAGNPGQTHWAAILVTGIGIFENWFSVKTLLEFIKRFILRNK